MHPRVPLGGFSLDPPLAPVAAQGPASGPLDGNYTYGLTYASPFGETTLGEETPELAEVAGTVIISNLPEVVPPIIEVNLYRKKGAGAFGFVADVTANARAGANYSDALPDDDVGAAPPAVNAAHSSQILGGNTIVERPLIYSVDANITASTTQTQAGGYKLLAAKNIVGTVANVGDALTLPAITSRTVGQEVTILNLGANSLQVYPAVGQSITGAGAIDAAVNIAKNDFTIFVARSDTDWAELATYKQAA